MHALGWGRLQPPRIFQIAMYFSGKNTRWYSGKTTWFACKQWKQIFGQETSAPPPPPWKKLVPYAYDKTRGVVQRSTLNIVGLNSITIKILLINCFQAYLLVFQSTPFKKSNAIRIWSIIFLLSWICIHHIPRKPVHLPFDWCLTC